MNSLDATERRRLRGKALALYGLLQSGRWCRQHELAAVAGYRYGARIADLRARGHVIESEKIGPSEWRYRMLNEAQGKLFGD